MGNKFSNLKSFTEAKITNFPLEDRRFIVACSGGVDSTALFRVFLEIFNEKKIFSLTVFHFNYGLRGGESDGDEAFCRALAEDNGLTFLSRRATQADHDARGEGGIQDWARRLRREALAQIAREGEKVVFAHHADDTVETILMRIMRGTSLRSMRGMAELDGKWWRPWLTVSKQDILATAEESGWLFREDSSNNQLDYTRNVLRHNVLPALHNIWPTGGTKLIELANDAFAVATYALQGAKAACHFNESSAMKRGASCHRDELCKLPDAVAFLVIADLIRAATSGDVRQISRSNLQKILAAARDTSSSKRFVLEVAKGVFVESSGTKVRSFPG